MTLGYSIEKVQLQSCSHSLSTIYIHNSSVKWRNVSFSCETLKTIVTVQSPFVKLSILFLFKCHTDATFFYFFALYHLSLGRKMYNKCSHGYLLTDISENKPTGNFVAVQASDRECMRRLRCYVSVT